MNALRPLSVGELLDSAIRTYRERFSTLVAAVAVPVIPIGVLQALVTWSAEPDAATDPFAAPSSAETIDGGQFALQVASSLVGAAAIMLATAVATAACFRALSAAYVGGEATWKESLAFGRTRMWSVIGLNLITTLGILVGLIFCLAPGFLALTFWAVATPAMLMEGLGVGDAMRRSTALARQRFWPVLGAVLLSTLVGVVFQAVIAVPLVGLLFTDVDGIVFYVVQTLVNLVALVLVTPFTAAFTMALYVDLRVRFEGFDLYLMAGTGPTQHQPGHVAPSGYGGGSFAPPAPPPPPPPSSGFGPPSSLPPPPRPPDDRPS